MRTAVPRSPRPITVLPLRSRGPSPLLRSGLSTRVAVARAAFWLPLAVGLGGGGCGSSAQSGGAAAPTGMAILSSDFAVSAVSLYNPASGLLQDSCVHTDTAGATLGQPLSGDVTLPSQAQQSGELVIIDRQNSVLSFVTPGTCVPRTQISVSTGGFKANPHDAISVSPHKVYVTRYETNTTPTADPSDFDEGDDLLVIDPDPSGSPAHPVLSRIPLTAFATTVAGSVIQARPDRGILMNGKVYVTLGSISADFSAVGAARVVVVDPNTDTATGSIDLPAGLTGCSAIDTSAASGRLYVSCGGTFGDSNQAAESGLVEIDVSAATPAARVAVAASAVGNLPVNFEFATVLGQTAFVGTLGQSDPTTHVMVTPDAFYAVQLATGTATRLLEGGAFNFGRASVDVAGKRVFLPDGDAVTPRVRIFDGSVNPPVAAGMFEANPGAHLPPREMAWY